MYKIYNSLIIRKLYDLNLKYKINNIKLVRFNLTFLKYKNYYK